VCNHDFHHRNIREPLKIVNRLVKFVDLIITPTQLWIVFDGFITMFPPFSP